MGPCQYSNFDTIF